MKEIMLNVSPQYAEKITSGYKLCEYRAEMLDYLKSPINLQNPVRAYIYETEEEDGRGKVIGYADIYCTFAPLYSAEQRYSKERTAEHSIMIERFNYIKSLYYKWCEKNGVKPNPHEGWFKSKRFTEYVKEIGGDKLSFNYVLMFENPVSYDIPKSLKSFSVDEPPQNMSALRTS